MTERPDILCIGSVLWDIIGRSTSHMTVGADRPGRISRLPGGVALNIAMQLARQGMRPALLTAIGRDAEGTELAGQCRRMGLLTDYAYMSDDLPTDRYMAVEGANGLVAAIADAHSLEAAGDKILRPLSDGRLGSEGDPFGGPIALDGNLTEDLLARIAESPLFAVADLRVAPASPGKVERLQPLLKHPRATLYVNLEEAGLLCHADFNGSQAAAAALIDRGARRVVVTAGGAPATFAQADGVSAHASPRQVMVTRVTGAGDTFMAAHIVAERGGSNADDALNRALRVAADYVSGDTSL